MSQEDQFYIGWQEGGANMYTKGRRRFFMFSLLALILISVFYLLVEKKFISSYFDYGNLTELQGTLVDYPVYGLKTIIDDKDVTVPLVGFGKFEADPVIDRFRATLDKGELNEYKVTLRGTMIQFNGKHWMELTEGDQSIINFEKTSSSSQEISIAGSTQIQGEIVDPKCFFGVMNPAYGKIHKSCAIRCISGGIPPILAVKENGVNVDYYFLLDEEGGKINDLILQDVGEPVSLMGLSETVDDWKVLKVDRNNISSTISLRLDEQFALCKL